MVPLSITVGDTQRDDWQENGDDARKPKETEMPVYATQSRKVRFVDKEQDEEEKE